MGYLQYWQAIKLNKEPNGYRVYQGSKSGYLVLLREGLHFEAITWVEPKNRSHLIIMIMIFELKSEPKRQFRAHCSKESHPQEFLRLPRPFPSSFTPHSKVPLIVIGRI